MDVEARAKFEAARQRANRVGGLVRELARELASEGGDTCGIIRAHDPPSQRKARDLIALGVERYGAVDVVVLARPGRGRSTPTTAPQGAKETGHGDQGRTAA